MNIILLFLAKPLDKHDITLVHIAYPPLDLITGKKTRAGFYDVQDFTKRVQNVDNQNFMYKKIQNRLEKGT